MKKCKILYHIYHCSLAIQYKQIILNDIYLKVLYLLSLLLQYMNVRIICDTLLIVFTLAAVVRKNCCTGISQSKIFNRL